MRAGNEKETDETADTVGCCSLRKEHITLHEQKDGKQYVVEFDFLGKDSIRYQNSVAVEKRVFKNLQLFSENKSGDDDIFDRLNVSRFFLCGIEYYLSLSLFLSLSVSAFPFNLWG